MSRLRRVYKRPPIVEALCQLNFEQSDAWDITLPGKLQAQLASYNGRSVQQQKLEASFQSKTKDQPSFQVRETLQSVQLPNKDGTRLVAIGPDVFSIHMLQPYVGWTEAFRNQIADGLDAYLNIAGVFPLKRIGLRYINEVSIAGESLNLEDYFATPLAVPTGFPMPLTRFMQRIESEIAERSIRTIYTFSSLPTENPADNKFILDIDVIWLGNIEKPAVDDVMVIVDEMKVIEHGIFESLITDRTRETFDA